MDRTLLAVTKLLSVLLLHALSLGCLSTLAAYSACSCIILTVCRYPVPAFCTCWKFDQRWLGWSVARCSTLLQYNWQQFCRLYCIMTTCQYLHAVVVARMSMQGLEYRFSQV